MRVLFVVHQFFPVWYTGTERFVLDLAKQLQRMGHFVKILTYGWRDNGAYALRNGALIREYHFQGVPVTAIRHRDPADENDFEVKVFDDRLEPVITSILEENIFDIIHIGHPHRCGSTCIKIAHERRIPVVLTLTDFWTVCPRIIGVTRSGALCRYSSHGIRCADNCYSETERLPLQERYTNIDRMLKMTDFCVSSTNFLKQVIQSNYPSLNIHLVRFGTDYSLIQQNSKLYSAESPVTIGFLSTLQPHKGAHILLKAFGRLDQDNISLKIYGHYFEEADYFYSLRELAEGKLVQFCGKYDYEDFQKIFDSLDIVAVPSIWWENSPLVLLSSLAHRVPVIVSNLEGLTEIIEDGKNGFVFDMGDEESLVHILQKIGQNPAVLNEIKNNIVAPPRIEEEAFRYELIYNNLTQNI